MPLRRRIFWKPRTNGGDFSQKPGAHSCSSSSSATPAPHSAAVWNLDGTIPDQAYFNEQPLRLAA
jgi:hypothetical protein